jgi:hypothetical protein
MWQLLRWLLWGKVCRHVWETKKIDPLFEGQEAVGYRVYMCCKECGTWKAKTLL